MFSYETYKLMHIASILLFTSMCTITFVMGSSAPKLAKILSGIASVLILVGGMGLLARIGVQHGSGFPFWVKAKLFIWCCIAIGGPIIARRFQSVKNIGLIVILVLLVAAAYFAINQF